MEFLSDYSTAQIIAGVAAAFAAAFVRGLAGFGMAILLVPVLALALDPVEAVMVTNVLGILVGITEFRRLVRNSERSAWVIGGLVIVTTPIGLWALTVTDPDFARLLIALIGLIAFAALLVPWKPHAEPGRGLTGSVGVTAGLLTGYAGMPGPPVVPYYVMRALDRETTKASMLLVFTIAAASGTAAGAALGRLELQIPVLAATLFPAVLAGNWLGEKASGKISDPVWRFFVGLVLGGAAVAALIRVV